LREIYDGHWSRNVGTDGGFTLTWRGRLVVIGAVTTAWDSAYQVVSTMGDRFVLVRLRTGDHRRAAGLQAMANVGGEVQMRARLAEVTGKLLAGAAAYVSAEPEPGLTETEMTSLLGLADLVTRARTPVERDYQGNPAFAHALEMPTRFAKQLVQIVRGGLLLGLDRDTAMGVAARCCHDTMPPLRRVVLADIAANPDSFTPDVADRVQMPKTTIDRALQELQLLGLLVVYHVAYGETAGSGGRTRLPPASTPATLPSAPEMSVPLPRRPRHEHQLHPQPCVGRRRPPGVPLHAARLNAGKHPFTCCRRQEHHGNLLREKRMALTRGQRGGKHVRGIRRSECGRTPERPGATGN
ncbi:MAG: hypothetical protein ACTHPS_30975, partial [Streptosporangiaceae bacterium]